VPYTTLFRSLKQPIGGENFRRFTRNRSGRRRIRNPAPFTRRLGRDRIRLLFRYTLTRAAERASLRELAIFLTWFTRTASTRRAWSGSILRQLDECAWRAESPCTGRWRTSRRELNELPHRTRSPGATLQV